MVVLRYRASSDYVAVVVVVFIQELRKRLECDLESTLDLHHVIITERFARSRPAKHPNDA